MKFLVFDKWLSKQINLSAYHLKQDFFLNKVKIPESFCFIDVKINKNKKKKIKFLKSLKFNYITTNIQFEKKLNKGNYNTKSCFFAKKKDRKQVQQIINTSHKASRFHLDKRLDNKIVSRIFKSWVQNFFQNKRGDYMIVSKIKNKINGFLLLIKEKKENKVRIDLIVVNKNKKNQGIGKSMIEFAKHNFFKKFKFIVVGTHIDNVGAVKFYKKLGFRKVSQKMVFHFLKK